MKYIIGVDPDSDKHGIAVFENGTLSSLAQWSIADALTWAASINEDDSVLFSIENVMANKFIYARNVRSNRSVQSKIAMSIGRCQQSQVELERILDHCGISFVNHKPTKRNWADRKAEFESTTGWTGRSNKDTRSAAYFGWVEAAKKS